MSATKIEWVRNADGTPGHVWNSVRGCSRKGPGCENCYAERMAAGFAWKGLDDYLVEAAAYIPDTGRRGPFYGFAEMTPSGPRWTGRVELIEHKLDEPLRRRKPTTYFVNSMSDLWHPALPLRDKARVYAVMVLSQEQNLGHLFQVLTKRPTERLQAFQSWEFWGMVDEEMDRICGERDWCPPGVPDLPLRNTWEGVSISTQADADRDIPILLQTPAALRMVSYEPALEGVDFGQWTGEWCASCGQGTAGKPGLLVDESGDAECRYCGGCWPDGFLDWLIAGGESGPGARPSHPDYFRKARDQCVAASVPFFFKGWGEWCPLLASTCPEREGYRQWRAIDYGFTETGLPNRATMVRVGKKAAGRLFDGREWNQMPEIRRG